MISKQNAYSLVYCAILGLLLTHELDAVVQHEWRILPILEKLDDELGRSIFIFGHAPLFFAVFWLSFFSSITCQRWTRIVVASFSLVHIILHLLWEQDGASTFNDSLSRLLINSAGLLGLVYVAGNIPLMIKSKNS